jgi:hypothetical protein
MSKKIFISTLSKNHNFFDFMSAKNCSAGPGCKFRANGTCRFNHSNDPIVCKFGEKCKFGDKCKNWHPNKKQACKFGSSCRDILNCQFLHSDDEIELAKFEHTVSSWTNAFDTWKLTSHGTEGDFVLQCYPNISKEEHGAIVNLIQCGAKLQEFECPFSDDKSDTISNSLLDEEEKFLLECERDFM